MTRLQDILELTPGNLITHLCKLEDADCVSTQKVRQRGCVGTSVTLTSRGRAALDAYTVALRDLLAGL